MRVMRLKEVSEIVGLGRSSIYKQMTAGTFPRQASLFGSSVGWSSKEIEAWVQARFAERDEQAMCSSDTSTH